MEKRYRGHYCKICGSIKSNEKFSGKGHKNHICKSCTKLPKDIKQEPMVKTNNEIFVLLLDNTEYINEVIDENEFDYIDDDDDDLPF